MKLLRALRNLFQIGLIWGVLWAALAMIAGTILGIIDPAAIDPGEEPIVLAPMIALVGFICGVVFGALVSTAEPSLSRVVFWGILVAAVPPLVAGKSIPEMLVTVPLGALSAVASVTMVRKWTALPVPRY
jgi:hypothetical protein